MSLTNDFRLPRDLLPRHYDLTIKTDLISKSYSGTVHIVLCVCEPTNKVVLNALGLNPGDGSLLLSDGKVLVPIAQAEDSVSERLTFVYPATLPVGSDVVLRIAFQRAMTISMEGYFLSPYEDKDKFFSLSFLAVSQSNLTT